MATKYWRGTADAVAQVRRAGVNTFDAATTYGITIGEVTVSVVGTTDEQTTTDALVTALNASTHVYFSGITWARYGSGGSSEVQGTADAAGVPFTFTTYANAGTGSWNAVSNATASAGPNDWSTASNWSDGSIPATGDTVILRDNSVDILWGLDQSAVTLAALTIEKSYTGKIGLNRVVFQQSASATSTAKTEYRDTYLKVSATAVKIGENNSQSTPSGSSRIMIDTGSNAATVEVFGTASTPAESGRPSVRLKFNHASSALYVRSAPGGVGIALDAPGETSALSLVSISDSSSSSRVYAGAGVSLTTWGQTGGSNILNAASTVTTVNVAGGTLTTEGAFAITTVNVSGGTLDSHSTGTITTLNLTGGLVDFQGSTRARTVTAVNLTAGTLRASGDVLSITTLNDPSGRYSLVAS